MGAFHFVASCELRGLASLDVDSFSVQALSTSKLVILETRNSQLFVWNSITKNDILNLSLECTQINHPHYEK